MFDILIFLTLIYSHIKIKTSTSYIKYYSLQFVTITDLRTRALREVDLRQGTYNKLMGKILIHFHQFQPVVYT